MPPSIVWFLGFLSDLVLAFVLITTILFFLRRIKNLRQWQDIYLTLAYILLAIGMIALFANLFAIPLMGDNPNTYELLKQLMRLYLVLNLTYLLPLAAFVKMTFRSKSRLATVLMYFILFWGGFASILIVLLGLQPVWDPNTWIILYVYDPNTMIFLTLQTVPTLLTIFWFSYEAVNLYLKEKRKDTPNPLQLRRFMFLALSGLSLIVAMVFSAVGFVGYTSPQDIPLFQAILLYMQPAILTDFFVLFSAIGWIMPNFAKKGMKTKKIEEGGT
ncbi:MAG: hypothetical protein ACFFC7_11315 [Candidatus Hermodarchaeota archaeon]